MQLGFVGWVCCHAQHVVHALVLVVLVHAVGDRVSRPLDFFCGLLCFSLTRIGQFLKLFRCVERNSAAKESSQAPLKILGKTEQNICFKVERFQNFQNIFKIVAPLVLKCC